MVESPKVRRSSSNGNQRLYNNNMKWVTVRPDINQKRSCNINIYGQVQSDEFESSSLGSSLEDYNQHLEHFHHSQQSNSSNSNNNGGHQYHPYGSSFVDLSGFTPNSFEFKYPSVGNSPSCNNSAVVPSINNCLKGKLVLDNWKLANPESTITIKKVKTSPRESREIQLVEAQQIDQAFQNSINNKLQPLATTQLSSSPLTTAPIANITTTNVFTAPTNTTGITRVRSRQLSKTPSYIQTSTTTTTPILSSSQSSASSLISHSIRKQSRAKLNQVDFNSTGIEKVHLQHALVLYNFEADLEEELNLVKDTTIIVVEQCADGWWKGRHLNSTKIATFPANYVKLIPSLLPQPTTQQPSSQPSSQPQQEVIQQHEQKQPTSNKSRSESIIRNNDCFKDDPNIFFPIYGNKINNDNGSFSFRSIRKNSITSSTITSIQFQIKIYVPPFHEHTIIQIGGGECLKDLLEKLGRKKKILFNDFKCRVRYIDSDSDLPLDILISSLKDTDKHPLKLYILGCGDYINTFNNSTTSIQLSNYFNISYNQHIKNNNNQQQQKQWVIFDNQSIQIYNNHTDQQAVRIVGLKYSTIKQSTSSPTSFILKTPFSVIKFTHDYFNIINQWVETIESCHEYLEGNPNIKKKQKKFIIKSSDSFNASTSSLSFSGQFPQIPDRKQQILEIRNKEINRVCVDCRSQDPEWASISLGCFLCDTCCGIHQRVIPNYEVLSVILDDQWEDNHINIFDKIGNSISNQYWEYNLLSKRIKPSSLPGEKESFIISKYKKKEFAPSQIPNPISIFNREFSK